MEADIKEEDAAFPDRFRRIRYAPKTTMGSGPYVSTPAVSKMRMAIPCRVGQIPR